MSYSPQNDELDFEIGALGDRLKKGFKKVGKVVTKVTDATIVKPSMMIGGAIGGKKGRELGRKLGKLTQKATHLGLGAGAAGVAAPILTGPTAVTAIAAGVAGKKLKKKFGKKKKVNVHAQTKVAAKAKAAGYKPSKCACDKNEAAKVGALLVSKLGGPLSEANKLLKLAELQRTATYEHKKLMSDAEFRKTVLQGIANMAANGDGACTRTIRVIMGR